jgi:hypothetical protein
MREFTSFFIDPRPNQAKRDDKTRSIVLALAMALPSCAGGSQPAAAGPPAVAPASPTPAAVPAATPATSASPAFSAAPATPAPTSSTTAQPVATASGAVGSASFEQAPGQPVAAPSAAASGVKNANPAADTGGGSHPSQTPVAVLTATTVSFLVDYNNSEARQWAEAACARDAKATDAEAKAACRQKAREKFLPDVLVFQRDARKNYSLVIYKRSGVDLKEVSASMIEFADETANSVRLKFKGGGHGQRPIFKGQTSVLLSVPNDYTLAVEDAELGKLTYEAKVGLINK